MPVVHESAERERAWRACHAQDLAWADFDDVQVVYHRPSGKTHFLNLATMQLLREILTQPTTVAQAAHALAQQDPAGADPAFVAAVAQSIAQLEHLGLVEPA